jgi:hypothetical protein
LTTQRIAQVKRKKKMLGVTFPVPYTFQGRDAQAQEQYYLPQEVKKGIGAGYFEF